MSDILNSIQESAKVIGSLESHAATIDTIRRVVIASLEKGGKVLTAGHGGSAADALHMAEELVGRFDRDRRALPAISLVADPTLLTCIGNDYGFDAIFPRQVEAHGREGDVLVIFSTSGNGEGFRKALNIARDRGVTTVTLLGKTGGTLRGMADHELIIASDETARIQEAHTLVMHIILEAVDEHFF